MIETLRQIARHLDVLNLIATDRHLVRVEGQNVRSHQHRIQIQARGDAGVGILASFRVAIHCRLVGMGAVEHALGRDTSEKPGQFGNLGNIRLAIERDPLGVQPGRQPRGSDLQP